MNHTIRLKERVTEMGSKRGIDPGATVTGACTAIEAFLKTSLRLPNGTTLAVLLQEFRSTCPEKNELHHELTTLRKIRNAISHGERTPWPGDEDLAIGTLKNFLYIVANEEISVGPQRRSISLLPAVDLTSAPRTRLATPLGRARLGWKEFESMVGGHFEDFLGKHFLPQVPRGLADGSRHVFDFMSEDDSTVIECKSHTWTKSGNYPSAKVADALVTAGILKKLLAKRKMLVFQDDFLEGQSLAEVFVRRNRRSLGGIEIWVYRDGASKTSARRSKHSARHLRPERLKPIFNLGHTMQG